MSTPSRLSRDRSGGTSSKPSRDKTSSSGRVSSRTSGSGSGSGKGASTTAQAPNEDSQDPGPAKHGDPDGDGDPDDGDDDGQVFLGFEHRMSTDERRRMREREREISGGAANDDRSQFSEGSGARHGTTATSRPASTYASRYTTSTSAGARLGTPSAMAVPSKSTAYSRQMEKRERKPTLRPARNDPIRGSMPADLTEDTALVRSMFRSELTAGTGTLPSSSSRHHEATPPLPLVSASTSGSERSDRRREADSRAGKSRSSGDRDRPRERGSDDRRQRTRSGSPSTRTIATIAISRDEDREKRREERRREREREDRRRRARSRDSTMSHSDNSEELILSSTRPSRSGGGGDDEDRRSRDDKPGSTTGDRARPARARAIRARSQEPDPEDGVSSRARRPGREEDTAKPHRSRSSDILGPESASRGTPTYSRRKEGLNDSKTSVGSAEPSNSLRNQERRRERSSDTGEASPYVRRDRLRSKMDTEQSISNTPGSRSSSDRVTSSRSIGSNHSKDNENDDESRKLGASSGTVSSYDSVSEEESAPPEDIESSSDEIDEKWTIRVCLISATDLPFNIVPNVPLCPILKFGLIKLPQEEAERLATEATTAEGQAVTGQTRALATKSSVSEQLDKLGILSFTNARVRCTSSKILSKRDNGAMEFHEDMRWDNVKQPSRAALAVELSARAAAPPPNFNESPLVKETTYAPGAALSVIAEPQLPASFSRDRWSTSSAETKGSGLDYDDLYQKALGKRATDGTIVPGEPRKDFMAIRSSGTGTDPLNAFGINNFMNKYNASHVPSIEKPGPSESTSPPLEEDGDDAPSAGIAGMRALWRKGRQQFEQRQKDKKKTGPNEAEAATAAVAVARFLIGGPSSDVDASKQPTEQASEPHNERPAAGLKGVSSQGDLRRDPFAPPGESSIMSSTLLKRPLQPQTSEMVAEDENVALVRPKKRRKIEMATDLRLGSLVIPLSRLPLAKVTAGSKAVRIEQWYQLECTTNTLTPSPTPTRRGLAGTSKMAARRNPSVLLEISFSSPEVLDESEDELEEESEGEEAKHHDTDLDDPKSFSRRASTEMRMQRKASISVATTQEEKKEKPEEKKKFDEDPVLEPGVCDFIAVVGSASVGDQRGDDGSRGWIASQPECVILEQFPPSDDFHHSHNRNVTLNTKAEWFCFPEGCRVWRGTEPPSHTDLNLKRFSASSPPNVASSIAAFDACLNCTTSFSWFVIQSNEKENDFKNTKTYGAVIKFYAPAPVGIDATQDDYAQPTLSGHGDRHERRKGGNASRNRLWVPLGLLMTSTLPIVGHMEAMLLRLCESLASRTGGSLHSLSHRRIQRLIHEDIANVIINFQKPIPGVLHCSIPFLTGERLHITVPPPTALPQLPHGASVTSVCRLLGSEGLNALLAAVLTECKILIHSDDIANLPMVAEVVTALIYPFVWSLPYLPVLPEAMVEFVEAPLSYFIGVPSCHMKLIDDSVLTEIVVIDLDNGFTSPDYYDGRRGGRQTKSPTPLPASVASNISKAVFRLLREEEEVEEEYGANNFPGSRSLPRLEAESLAEREFRIAVALQICGLVRGYDDCLFKVSASQPVFNRDKFLRTAPALFEDRRGNASISGPASSSQRMLSPRSKRFLSLLVNCQHFHQFLESLDHDECAFFNEVMYTFDMNDDRAEDHSASHGGYGGSKLDDAASHLTKALQKVEDKIPTYRVDRKMKKKKRGGGIGFESGDDDDGVIEDLIEGPDTDDIGFSDDGNLISSFTTELLGQVVALPGPGSGGAHKRRKSIDDSDALSVESALSGEPRAVNTDMLQRLEKSAWEYNKLFEMVMPSEETSESGVKPIVELREKVKLRDAIGERRYRAWKVAQEQKLVANDTSGRMFTADVASAEGNKLDLTTLLSQVGDEATMTTEASSMNTISTLSTTRSQKICTLSPEQQRVTDAKDRETLRRCLERAYEGGGQRRPARFGRRPSITATSTTPSSDTFFENGRDLIADAETALRNPSAQKFLVSVLSQRSRLENQRKRRGGNDDSKGRRQSSQPTVSRLEPPAFDCLIRLCCAMLDACMESRNYEAGYNLLTHTQGFCSVQTKDGKPLSKKDSEFDQGTKVVYMTAKISLHPIFAELELWEHVLQLHLKERENDKNNTSEDKESDKGGKANSDIAAYETTVSTLYEMLGYGIPAEELARFSTQVSEKRGWFSTERGHSLLMLARRLSVKRENGDDGTGNAGDLDMMRSGTKTQSGKSGAGKDVAYLKDTVTHDDEDTSKFTWSEIGWCHPAAANSTRPSQYSNEDGGTMSSRLGASNLLNMIGTDKDAAKEEKKKLDESKYLKRSAVTTLASFGSSVVASGGLDGSVFVAHTIKFASESKGKEKEDIVRGVRLDWGSSGSRSTVVGAGSSDGEYGVGAVSCLAAAKGAGYRSAALNIAGAITKDVMSSKPDEDDILSAMEGCRVIAGTTGGDLRVWSVKDVYAATVLARKGSEALSCVDEFTKPLGEMRISHGQDSTSSSYISRSKRGGSITEIAAGSAFSRLKFSLRGRALSGHRGGVSCIDVPSHIYRPDALVTGGADGFIKLWSLRAPTGRRTSGELMSGGSNTPLFNTTSLAGGSTGSNADPMGGSGRKGGRGGDALSILAGHTGRVLCVKTAWHGDRLLSGGADRTVRIWDLAGPGGGGKCLHALTGHLGWVTHTHYWGPNTIVSASTDRAIALWDARVKKSPLFVLRYHQSPISDLLVGSRTDPLMVSAAADGTVATWDFRMLSGGDADKPSSSGPKVDMGSSKSDHKSDEKHSKAIRDPPATMLHSAASTSSKQSGAVLLSRGTGKAQRTVITVGSDAVAREWEIATGRVIRAENTGHCDVVSSLQTFSDGTMGASSGVEPIDGSLNFGGTITSSWDGTIRMKKLVRR